MALIKLKERICVSTFILLAYGVLSCSSSKACSVDIQASKVKHRFIGKSFPGKKKRMKIQDNDAMSSYKFDKVPFYQSLYNCIYNFPPVNGS